MKLAVNLIRTLMLFSLLMFVTGCGPTILDAKRAINEAMQYQENVSRTGIADNATPDVPLIKSKLSDAEKSMKFLLFPKAFESARDSIDASKRVLLYIDAKRLVDEAGEYQATVKRTAASGSSSPDINGSVQKFSDAEKQLAEHQYQRAIADAKDSITFSKRVILQGITSSVKIMKEEIVKKQEENPATPLKKILPRLDEILQFANEVQSDEKGLEQMSLVKAASITSDLKVYEEDIKSSQQEKLQSDISFAIGKYDLAQDGKAALEKFADKIAANIESSLLLFPDKPLVLQVDVYGYTDSSGFLSDGGNLKKRALLNQRLSELRAKSVSDCINRFLTQKLATYGSRVSIHSGRVVGHGEELPPGVPLTSHTSNPQRRICQIFSTTVHDVVK